jgi:anti-sigma B factor antagonist
MNPTTASLSIWVGDHTACIRVTGRANFVLSVDFRRLLQQLASSGHGRVALDLSACQLMDSTFLGVLAHEAGKRVTKSGGQSEPGLELWNLNERIHELIHDLGVAHLFRIVPRQAAPDDFTAAPAACGASKEELTRTCLEAHELLMALNPANVPKFKEAAQYFAEELNRTRSRPDPAGSAGGGAH